MKTKTTFLIAAWLLLVTVSKAQYGAPYPENRVAIQGQVVIPGHAVVDYNYHNMERNRFDEQDERREGNPVRYADHGERRDGNYGSYPDQRDRRMAEYERFCHEHRGNRISREEFFRIHYGYRVAPYCAPRRVVVYGY
jgi:hypothetical protein